MNIPFLDMHKVNQAYEYEIQKVIGSVLTNGRYILGDEVKKFEKNFSEIQSSNHASAVANGMDAIEIALRCKSYRAGSEVLTTSVTAVATVLAIIRAGLKPILVDIDPATGLMDLKDAERKMGPSTVCVVYVHLYGNVTKAPFVKQFCDDHKIDLLEDCAQAHLGMVEGKTCGNFGFAGAFSFYPTKNLGALGDAGALLTNTKDIKRLSDKLRNYGQSDQYQYLQHGLNSRMDEIQAAILNVKIKMLRKETLKRIQIATTYNANIKNSRVSVLRRESGDFSDVYHLYVLYTQNRPALCKYLQDHKIGFLIHYPKSIGEYEVYSALEGANSVPNADQFTKNILSIPCNAYTTTSEVEYIVDVLNRF